MAVRTMDEILESVNEILGDNTDDNAITFLEDLTDTITDLEDRANGDGTDWESRYRENDAAWRKKYKERFYSNEPASKEPEPEPEPEQEPEPEPPKKFEDLFTTK